MDYAKEHFLWNKLSRATEDIWSKVNTGSGNSLVIRQQAITGPMLTDIFV